MVFLRFENLNHFSTYKNLPTKETRMNIFQLVADLMHVVSIAILLLKMKATRSAAGLLE